MEANLAAPMVDEFCRVDDSFQALARRFAANVEKESNLDNLGELDLVSID